MRWDTAIVQLLLLGGVLCPSVWAQELLLKMDHLAEHQEYPLGATELRVQVRVRAVDEAPKRSPVGLTAVVDTSGSMTGPRTAMLKDTLRFLALQMLENNGAMGVVIFSDKAQELFQFQEINDESHERLLAAIDLITADGRTDLSDGIVMGLDQIGAAEDTNAKCRTQEVFVFTDGDPNQGVTKRRKILDLVDRNRENNVRVTTFPFGVAANFALLQDIADKGEGEAYVIEDMQGIGDAFGMAVARLLTTVAQNIKMTFNPLNGARIKTLMNGYRVVEKGNSYRVIIPNLALEESNIPLLILELPTTAGAQQHQEVMQVELSYEDTTACKKVVEEDLIITVLRKENPDRGGNSTEVIENLCRLTMGDALEVTEASIDAEMTLLVASEMERIAHTMRTQNCCENSTIIPKFILGADQLAAQLRSSTKPTDVELAVYREVGDTLVKGVTTLPSIDTEDFHFMGEFETSFSKQKRKEAREAIIGGNDTPSSEDPPDGDVFVAPGPDPFPVFPQMGRR